MKYFTLYYLLCFSWGICILTSLVGWGGLIRISLFPKDDIYVGQRAAWGVGISVFIGGILNLFGLISKYSVISYLGLGCVIFLILDLSKVINGLLQFPSNALSLWQEDKVSFLGSLIVALLASLHYLVNINKGTLLPDDVVNFAAFPLKMLQQGGLGFEPFSSSRMLCLGGQSFLHTFVLCVLSPFSIYIIEPGIAYFIVTALLWDLSKRLKISRRTILFICILFLSIPRTFWVNSSACVMGLAMLLALFLNFDSHVVDIKPRISSYAFVSALLVAALCALKSNLIIFSVAYFGIAYLLQFIFLAPRRLIFFELLISIFFIGFFLLPWMLSSYQSSGTLLYPVLGRGYHYSAYGILEYPPAGLKDYFDGFFRVFYTPPIIFLSAFLLLGIKDCNRRKIVLMSAVYLSAFVGTFVVAIFTREDRFAWPGVYASLAALMCYVCGNQDGVKNFRSLSSFWFVTVMIVPHLLQIDSVEKIAVWKNNELNYKEIFENITFKKTEYKQKVSEYFNAQKSVPEGETIIAAIPDVYLLDFHRNRVLIVNYLVFGPKPGMPIFAGGEAVAHYLMSEGMRYVMYSNENDIGTMEQIAQNRPRGYKNWRWVEHCLHFTFWKDILGLAKTRKKIYDDGTVFVLDLASGPPK